MATAEVPRKSLSQSAKTLLFRLAALPYHYPVAVSYFSGDPDSQTFVEAVSHAFQSEGIAYYHYRESDLTPQSGKSATQALVPYDRALYYVLVFSEPYLSSEWTFDEFIKIFPRKRRRLLFSIGGARPKTNDDSFWLPASVDQAPAVARLVARRLIVRITLFLSVGFLGLAACGILTAKGRYDQLDRCLDNTTSCAVGPGIENYRCHAEQVSRCILDHDDSRRCLSKLIEGNPAGLVRTVEFLPATGAQRQVDVEAVLMRILDPTCELSGQDPMDRWDILGSVLWVSAEMGDQSPSMGEVYNKAKRCLTNDAPLTAGTPVSWYAAYAMAVRCGDTLPTAAVDRANFPVTTNTRIWLDDVTDATSLGGYRSSTIHLSDGAPESFFRVQREGAYLPSERSSCGAATP